jgi:hypothetical protein
MFRSKARVAPLLVTVALLIAALLNAKGGGGINLSW